MTERPEDAGPPPGRPPEADDDGARGTGHAWRLTFAYEGDDVRVVDRRRVRMQAPADDSARVERAEDGFWLEVRDASDTAVYRQVLHEPIATEYEVFSPERMRHVAVPDVRGVFQTVVPDLPDAADVVLHGPAVVGPGREAREGDETADQEAGEDATAEDAERGRRRRAGPDETPGAPPRGRVRTLLRAPLRPEKGDDRGNG